MAMIDVRHLSKKFGDQDVLTDVSFAVERGETVSVIGPAGSGKSTLLRCLSLFERPDNGEIVLDGELVLELKKPAAAIRAKVGLAAATFELLPHLTLIENVALGPEKLLKLSPSAARERGNVYLEKVGLGARGSCWPDELTKGQRRRGLLARSLAMEPRVLLLDDPTASLEMSMESEVMDVLRNLAESDLTILIAADRIPLARELSSRIFYLDEGTVYEEGRPDEIFERPKRPKTEAFVRTVESFRYEIDDARFDRFEMSGRLRDFCAAHCLSDRTRRDLVMLLDEVLVNRLIQAKGERPNVTVMVHAGPAPGTLSVTLTTPGPPVDVFMPRGYDDQSLKRLMQLACERHVTVEKGVQTIRMTLRTTETGA